MARVTNRRLRRFVFGEGKRRKRRSGRRATGVAARAKNAPKHCKVSLGSCMRGPGGRAKAGRCMKAYWGCIKRA